MTDVTLELVFYFFHKIVFFNICRRKLKSLKYDFSLYTIPNSKVFHSDHSKFLLKTDLPMVFKAGSFVTLKRLAKCIPMILARSSAFLAKKRSSLSTFQTSFLGPVFFVRDLMIPYGIIFEANWAMPFPYLNQKGDFN